MALSRIYLYVSFRRLPRPRHSFPENPSQRLSDRLGPYRRRITFTLAFVGAQENMGLALAKNAPQILLYLRTGSPDCSPAFPLFHVPAHSAGIMASPAGRPTATDGIPSFEDSFAACIFPALRYYELSLPLHCLRTYKVLSHNKLTALLPSVFDGPWTGRLRSPSRSQRARSST